MIPVVWQNYNKKTTNKGFWDTGFLELLFEKKIWKLVEYQNYDDFKELPAGTEGTVVVIGVQRNSDWYDEKLKGLNIIERLNKDLSQFKWILLILVGDEESVFDWKKIKHSNIKIWVMTPNVEKHKEVDCVIGEFYRKEAQKELRKCAKDYRKKSLDWYFCGQITHERRQEWAKRMREILKGKLKGELVETKSFAEMKVPMDEYYKKMASAKVVPCPSGPVTPSSFRTFEALEAGSVPIVDDYCPANKTGGYWKFIFENPPFPILTDYDQLEGYISDVVSKYPEINNKVFAWWQNYKRNIAYKLDEHIRELSGKEIEKNKITVLIPTSPIESHPNTSIIEETINNIRLKLPDSEILIMIDGVRQEQEHLKKQYQEYIHRLLWMCNNKWMNVLPIIFENFEHQVGMTRKTLEMVKTPLILFAEHDTPITPDFDFDWENMSKIILSGDADVIRFHPEALILKEHRHLMLDNTQARKSKGVPMTRTIQWSQRPHLTSTEYYRCIMEKYFSKDAKTMIEDKMHGVVQDEGWDKHKLWIYTPEGNIKRSYHLDGRGNESKYDMTF